jgi:GABA permease
MAAIVVFLFLGTLYVLGLWPDASLSFANLTAQGRFAPNGIAAVLAGAVAATGFYFGAEIVTIAAAESAEPERAVAKATNSMIARVLIFYIGSVFLVVAIVPWNDAGRIATPYVSALEATGIPAAAC